MATSRTIADITRIVLEVVRTHSFPVSIIGSVPANGGSSYTEILLSLDGYADSESRVQLAVFRDSDTGNLRQQIADQIGRHLRGRR